MHLLNSCVGLELRKGDDSEGGELLLLVSLVALDVDFGVAGHGCGHHRRGQFKQDLFLFERMTSKGTARKPRDH